MSELKEFLVIFLIMFNAIGFLSGMVGGYDCCGVDVCKRERIVDYFPATVMGCELFKKRFKE